jgi:hypothetical protein
MSTVVARTEDEINDLRNAVTERIDEGGSRYSGMSYEQGIDEALRWVFGETDDHPYFEEE